MHNSQKRKGGQKCIADFNKNALENLENLRQSVINGNFHTSNYKSKVIYEPKKRTIYMLPYAPDRIVQHALMNVLIPYFEKMFISDSYACIKGRGQQKAVLRCSEFTRRNAYCLQCDIHHFYPSIDQNILSKMYHKKFKDKKLLKIIDDIIFSFPGDKNCPIGNYTSQWSGNFYLTSLDNYIKHDLKAKDYLRYCDDFLIFSNDKKYLHDCRVKIEAFIKSNLKLSFSKANVFSTKQGVDFCGYRTFGKYILMRKSTSLRMKRDMKKKYLAYKKGRLPPEKLLATVDSRIGWLKHGCSYNLRKSMNLDNIRKEILNAQVF